MCLTWNTWFTGSKRTHSHGSTRGCNAPTTNLSATARNYQNTKKNYSDQPPFKSCDAVPHPCVRDQFKCDGKRAETNFRLWAKRTSSFKSAGASFQSTDGIRGVRISGSNAGYTMFRGSVNSTGYPLHSPVFPSLLLPCVFVSHYISTGVYLCWFDVVQNLFE